MSSIKGALRRGIAGAFAVSATGGVALAVLMVPAAGAATDPCAASEVAKTIGNVATDTGEYLDAHPQTNQALTTISKQQAGPQSLAALKTYFGANPQVAKDMQTLQQPLASLGGRCQLPLSIPQLMGLVQAAQQQGSALPGSLPAGLPSAQSVGVPGVSTPVQSAPASAASSGTGPLPGPTARSAR